MSVNQRVTCGYRKGRHKVDAMGIRLYTSITKILREFDPSPEEEKAIRAQIKEANCWGFIEDLKTIHIYTNSKTTRIDLMELCAHELTHAGYKELQSYNEEDFCTRVAAICTRAYDMAKTLVV